MTEAQVTDARVRRITIALGLALLLAAVLYLAFGGPEGSSVQRGDFPAFYAAAEIVWTGQTADLYDHELQKEIQNRHWPDFAGQFYIFAYPPFFAQLLSPLAALSPLTAKAAASAILFFFLLGALVLARETSPFFRAHFLFSLLYLLTLVPVGGSIVGVQNTALSILCFALVYWAMQTERPLLTGLAASLLLYKPQFGMLLFLFLLARRRAPELLGWGIGALSLYLLGALTLGFSWPLAWLTHATEFGDMNFTINDQNMISLAGMLYWAFAQLFGNGARILPWAYLLSAVLLLLSIRYIQLREARFILAPYLILFLSPQTLFYDLGIAAFWFMRGLCPNNLRDFWVLAALWLYSAIAISHREQVSFPLFALPLVLLFWLHLRKIQVRPLPGS